jgi:hypothetical protein
MKHEYYKIKVSMEEVIILNYYYTEILNTISNGTSVYNELKDGFCESYCNDLLGTYYTFCNFIYRRHETYIKETIIIFSISELITISMITKNSVYTESRTFKKIKKIVDQMSQQQISDVISNSIFSNTDDSIDKNILITNNPFKIPKSRIPYHEVSYMELIIDDWIATFFLCYNYVIDICSEGERNLKSNEDFLKYDFAKKTIDKYGLQFWYYIKYCKKILYSDKTENDYNISNNLISIVHREGINLSCMHDEYKF